MSPIVVVGAGIIGYAIAYELQRRGQPSSLSTETGRGGRVLWQHGQHRCHRVHAGLPAVGSGRKCRNGCSTRKDRCASGPPIMPRLSPGFCASSTPAARRSSGRLRRRGPLCAARVYEDLCRSARRRRALQDDAERRRLPESSTPTRQNSTPTATYRDSGSFRLSLTNFSVAMPFANLNPLSTTRSAWPCSFPQNRSVSDPLQAGPETCSNISASLVALFEHAEMWSASTMTIAALSAVRLARRPPTRSRLGWSCAAGPYRTPVGKCWESRSRSKRSAAITRRSWRLVFPCAIRSSGRPGPSWSRRRPAASASAARSKWPASTLRRLQTLQSSGEAGAGGTARPAGGEYDRMDGHRPAHAGHRSGHGPSAKRAVVFYATGHGHLGLTYAPRPHV